MSGETYSLEESHTLLLPSRSGDLYITVHITASSRPLTIGDERRASLDDARALMKIVADAIRAVEPVGRARMNA